MTRFTFPGELEEMDGPNDVYQTTMPRALATKVRTLTMRRMRAACSGKVRSAGVDGLFGTGPTTATLSMLIFQAKQR